MDIGEFLEAKVLEYEQPAFIAEDPVSIPHLFQKKQDIEIAGFFTALFSWGHRKIIISKSRQLMELMDGKPHDFILEHTEQDLRRLMAFKHRTFCSTDLLFLISFLQKHYRQSESLETAFTRWVHDPHCAVEQALNGFHVYCFSGEDIPQRTRKHISAPKHRSTCKRLNMFLRWMVRPADRGVDFGIWKGLNPEQLMIPLDLHVGRVARHVGLLTRKQNDWQAVLELTEALQRFHKTDPVRYDYALFSLGVMERF